MNATAHTPPSKHRRAWPWIALAMVALLALLTATGAWWALRTEGGLRWTMDHIPGLRIDKQQGRPDDGPFSAGRVQWEGAGLRIVLHDVAWQDADWTPRPHPGAWMAVALQSPRVRLMEVFSTDQKKAEEDAPPPSDLSLPVALALRQLRIGAIHWNAQPVLADLAGDVHVGDRQGAVHHVDLQARFQQYRLQARGSVEAAAPLQTEGRLELATLADASQPWQAQGQWRGTVKQPALSMHLAMRGRQILTAQAGLLPFAEWPLEFLNATTDQLDLAMLHPALPATSLTGTATVTASGAATPRGAAGAPGTQSPMSAQLTLHNALAGAWSAGALPIQQLRLGAEDRSGALVITEVTAALKGDQQAGHIQGSGQWKGQALSLALKLSDLRPGAIHQQAPAMELHGTATLSLLGLPPPPGRASADAVDQPRSASPADPDSTLASLSGEADIALAGRLAPQSGVRKDAPVSVKTHAVFSMQGEPQNQTLSLRLAPLSLTAGQANAQAQASLTRDAQQGWHIVSDGRLASFDPSAWWAGPAGADWRRMRHELNGEWSVDMKGLPPPATGQQHPSLLASLRGQGRVQLENSMLAGVPLTGHGQMQAGDTAAHVSGELRAAFNAIDGDLRWPHGRDPEWSARIDAPALKSLTPWQRLAPQLAQWLPVSGTVRAKASGQGAWPALKTSGSLQAQGVASQQWGVAQARASWQAELSRPDAPLSMDVQATDARWSGLAIERAKLTADGTLAAHRLALDARATQLPANDAEMTAQAAVPPAPRTDVLQLMLHGRWAPREGCAGTWRGAIDRIAAWPANKEADAWLQASNLQATVQTTQPCGLASARLAPNEVKVLGSTLRWTTAEMVAGRGDKPMDLRLDARLLPVQVAPLLDRLGQGERWHGDLEVAGRVHLRSGAKGTLADIELARTRGDLAIQEASQAKGFSLGLRALKVSATSRGGTWRLTQHISGQAIGTLSGAQSIRMDQPGLLPGPKAALSGTVEMKLERLSVWSAWIPPPWRIDGQLAANVALAGTAGAPDYRGRLTGSKLAVRNVLEGIELKDGELALALQGQQATLEKLLFRGGKGTLTAKGSASFAAEPRASLRIVASDLLATGRVDRRIVVSGQSTVELGARRIAVNGNFTVDEGLIDITQASAPRLDEDVVIRPRPGQAALQPPRGDTQADKGEGFEQIDMSVSVDLGQQLRLTGRGIDTKLAGALRITTPDGELAVHGTVRTEGGRYAAYGQNLSIDRGVIRFNGDLDTPTLDVLALRTDVDMRVGVAITGYAADPRVRLYSEPDMSDIDKLSWLVMGRASEGLGKDDTALLQRAALALLAGDKKRSSKGFAQRLGLDQLSLARGASGDLRDTVVTLGKQLSDRWHVGYAQGLNATSGSWQLIYRVARQFTVRLSAGADSAVDIVKTWRFDGRGPRSKGQE